MGHHKESRVFYRPRDLDTPCALFFYIDGIVS